MVFNLSMPNVVHISFIDLAVNCEPQSVSICWGIPTLLEICHIASATLRVVMTLNGTASSHLLAKHIQVSRY